MDANRITKFKSVNAKKADAAADIDIINQFAVGELTPEDVYCFTVDLCGNDVDRDLERFTNATLDALAPMFCGATGLSDHLWSVDRQIARLYRTGVVAGEGKNSLGEPLRVLRGSAYMLNNAANKDPIEMIDGGIVKEVSTACAISKCSCSICGESFKFDYRTYKNICKNDHVKGESYDGKLCFGNLENPTEAYEFSFVAVPAQRGAGVTKSDGDTEELLSAVMERQDLREHKAKIMELMPVLNKALADADELETRAKILAENAAVIKKYARKKD